MKKVLALAVAFFMCVLFSPGADAAGWYWLSSDTKYTKEFDPSSVVVTKSKNVNGKAVATEIMVWTKTAYTYAGAVETIKGYNMGNIIKNPANLAYSLAQIVINPQARTARYKQEIFYNPKGEPIYNRENGRVKEINSQEFDEAFYASAVDEVFRMGEMARCKAKDRWITLWTAPVANETVTVTADTTTFRLRDDNLIFWEWEEHKNLNDKITEIRFQKKRVNIKTQAEQLISGRVWTEKKGWSNISDPYEGRYHKVDAASPAIKGIQRLVAYAKGYSTWVNRYRTDIKEESPKTVEKPAAQTTTAEKNNGKPSISVKK